MTTGVLYNNNDKPKHSLVLIGILLWFATMLILSFTGILHTTSAQLPFLLISFTTVPPLAFLLLYGISSSVKQYVLNLDIRMLVLLHSWRMLGISFLMLYTLNFLPLSFALPAGLGDALVAILASIIVIAFFNLKQGVNKKWLRSWNNFGILDFFVAVSIGLAARSGNIAQLENSVGSDILSQYPLSIIPGFIVPFFLITHFIIHLQLQHRFNNNTHIKLD